MIKIFEGEARKCVGKTTLYVLFEYNQRFVNLIKTIPGAAWHKDILAWEVSLNQLALLIDIFCTESDIEITLLEDKNEELLETTIDYKTTPRSYQIDGIKYLLNNRNSLILDEPGLGKTLQIIYTAEELKKQKGIEHCLIICGINSLKTNWRSEIDKHSYLDCMIIGERIKKNGERVIDLSNSKKAEQLTNKIDEFFIILNIEALRDKEIVDALIKQKNNKFDMIAFDECHKAKNPMSVQGKNLLKLAKKVGKYHYGMTGTLIMNNPLDSYVPLTFIGAESAAFGAYKQMYCVFDMFNTYGRREGQIISFKNLDMLQTIIDNNSIRRTAKDALPDLPELLVIPERVELTSDHYKFYAGLAELPKLNSSQRDVIESIKSTADLVELKSSSLLGMVVRLRQSTSCPHILTSLELENSKIIRALEIAREAISNDNKVIIFSTFIEPLKVIGEALSEYSPLFGTGEVDDIEYENNKNKFQTDDKYKVFLATCSKSGTGITLTAANYVIFIDTPWTFAEFEQCYKRAYRFGAKKTVFVYDLIAAGTIDERVYQLVMNKKDLSDFIVDGTMSETLMYKYLLGDNLLN